MDIEKTMEFILGQQAKFAAGLEEMRERQGVLQSFVERIAQQQLDLTQHVNHFQREISAAVLAIAEAQRQLTEEHARLEEAQRHTEERLNRIVRRLPAQ